jgi:hypothetical protein
MRNMSWMMLATLGLVCAACGGEASPGRIEFTMALSNLPPMPARMGVYEGWALVQGLPVSTGRFVVDVSTNPAQVLTEGGQSLGPITAARFGPASTGLGNQFPFIVSATGFFITIEPPEPSDGVPSNCIVMAGDFVGTSAALSMAGVAHGQVDWSLGDHSAASAVVRSASPTNGNLNPDQGLWFVSDAAGTQPGFDLLPPRTDGWRYEAWTLGFLADGPLPVTSQSMGIFTQASGRDRDAMSSPTRGSAGPGYPFPGADFLTSVSESYSALALNDGQHEVRITLEPVDDNAESPFPVTLLSAPIPTNAVVNGASAANISLQAVPLPELTLSATAAAVSITGDGLRDLGGAERGEYVLWAVMPPLSEPVIVARVFIVGGLVRAATTNLIVGAPSNVVLTAANTGLGAGFPNVSLATTVFVTIEAQGGPSFGLPSGAPLYAGAMTAGSSTLTLAGVQGYGLGDFTEIEGSCILAAPTRLPSTSGNDSNGVWFVDLATRAPALDLPTLALANWCYEGWVVNTATGETRSTGKFRSPQGHDGDWQSAPGHDLGQGYAAPGADFLLPWQREVEQGLGGAVIVSMVPLDYGHPSVHSPFTLFYGGTPLSGGGVSTLVNMAASWPSASVSY